MFSLRCSVAVFPPWPPAVVYVNPCFSLKWLRLPAGTTIPGYLDLLVQSLDRIPSADKLLASQSGVQTPSLFAGLPELGESSQPVFSLECGQRTHTVG